MRAIEAVAAVTMLFFVPTGHTVGQENNNIRNECDSLRNTSLSDLVQFLNAVAPDEKNGDCLTWAIRKLGNENYEAAIPALVRLLDFRRPLTSQEKMGFYVHPQGIWDLYPAAGALSLIGKKALPEVLDVIRSESASSRSRENAVFVWMEIHRFSDEHPRGVALLRQEENNTKDNATKRRLEWALQKAISWCNPPEEAACRQAALAGVTSAP